MLSVFSSPPSCWFLSPPPSPPPPPPRSSPSSPPPCPPSHHCCSGPALSLVGRIQSTHTHKHTHTHTHTHRAWGDALKTHSDTAGFKALHTHRAKLLDSRYAPTQPHTHKHAAGLFAAEWRPWRCVSLRYFLMEVSLGDIKLENHPSQKTKVLISIQFLFSLMHVTAFLHIYISSSHNNNPPGALCKEDVFRASWNSSNQSRTEIKTGNIYECLSSVWLLSSVCLRLRVPVSAGTACHPKQKSVSPARFLISQKGPVLLHSSQETAELADERVKEILLANLCALSTFVATS